MSPITRKRLLPLDEESQHIGPTNRCGSNCIKKKLTKLSLQSIPGVDSISQKRSFPWEDNSLDIFPAKRLRNHIIKKNLTIISEPEVPKEFLMGLPVLLDSDYSDSEECRPKSEKQMAKPETEDDRNLFTYQQLKSMCWEMMKQCEDGVVLEYEIALTQKMAEQYDTFIKFNHDQLQRECEHGASYLS
ncbi:uncharacterized protein LOC27208661 [Drosophila simulans]|uniref:Akirin n=1 Tax=Drosophila simulans TaxID=7240 RepID=A0A0J9R3T0_DROSI|nr:uncharacterized protein LOC27208661 [Drosophila simulans]KMY90743.1 uncharacterized protein Dsimw501_GD28817 [Drosophila simulans]